MTDDGYESALAKWREAKAIISELRLNIDSSSPVGDDIAKFEAFHADRASMQEDDWKAKWLPQFNGWYQSQIVVKRLSDAVVTLKDQPGLRPVLSDVLEGPLAQDFSPSQAKDKFYELELASLWAESGFEVALREPDLVLSGNGLSGPVAVACKYPSSEQQVHPHLSKGYSQISKHGFDGFVAVGLDLILFKEMKFLDFNRGEKHPLEVLRRATSEAVETLVTQRQERYPSEVPVDGLMVTLRAFGVHGNPASLTECGFATMQLDDQNPRRSDFTVLYQSLFQSVNRDTGE